MNRYFRRFSSDEGIKNQMDYKDYPILYVDDKQANRILMKANLDADFTVLLADSTQKALEIVSDKFVAVLLTEQQMPGETGVDLAEKVRGLYPEVKRIIITATSDLEATIEAINRARVNRFIRKPVVTEEIAAVIKECIQSYHDASLVHQLQEKIIQWDRVSSLSVIASSIAHDLNQPLSYIEPTIKMMRSDIQGLMVPNTSAQLHQGTVNEILEQLDDVSHGIERMKIISTTLLKSLRTEPYKMDPVNMRKIVENAVTITKTVIVNRASLNLELPQKQESTSIIGSESQGIQLIVNMLLNAVNAIEIGASSTNRISLRLKTTDESVTIEVEDTGRGFAPEEVKNIFSPFFVTNGELSGGLGLPICKQVVEELNGTIRVDTQKGHGTCYYIDLPKAPLTMASVGP